MDANVIDTLRFADRLKDAGFDAPKADGLARALGDELSDRVLTRIDHDALGLRIDGLDTKFDAKFEAMEAKFDARFEGLEAKFDARFEGLEAKFDARFEGLEAKFEGLEAKFGGLEAKFGGLEAKFEGLEARFEGLEARFVGLAREFDTQFESLRTNMKTHMTVFAIGFSVVIGLGLYNVVAS